MVSFSPLEAAIAIAVVLIVGFWPIEHDYENKIPPREEKE